MNGLVFTAILYLMLLTGILMEGEPDTPRFFDLPRSTTDFVRILIHGYEVIVVTWFFIGTAVLGSLPMAAWIEVVLAVGLVLFSAMSRWVDPRFSRTGYGIAFFFGLVSLPLTLLYS